MQSHTGIRIQGRCDVSQLKERLVLPLHLSFLESCLLRGNSSGARRGQSFAKCSNMFRAHALMFCVFFLFVESANRSAGWNRLISTGLASPVRAVIHPQKFWVADQAAKFIRLINVRYPLTEAGSLISGGLPGSAPEFSFSFFVDIEVHQMPCAFCTYSIAVWISWDS